MLRFATGIAPWLPGMSAGSRLGLEDRDGDGVRDELQTAVASTAREKRLPTRDDAFYWSLMHSHL